MSDQYVQVIPDQAGKKVETSELIRTSDSVVVERQRVALADGIDVNALANVLGAGTWAKIQTRDETMIEHLIGIRRVLDEIREILELSLQ